MKSSSADPLPSVPTELGYTRESACSVHWPDTRIAPMIDIWCDIRGGIQNAERCNLSANVSFVTACNYIAMTRVCCYIIF